MMHPTRRCGMVLLFLVFSNNENPFVFAHSCGDSGGGGGGGGGSDPGNFDKVYSKDFKTTEECEQQCGYVAGEAEAICLAAEGGACLGESLTSWLTGGGACQAAGSACKIRESFYILQLRKCEEYCDSAFPSEFELINKNFELTNEKIDENFELTKDKIDETKKDILDDLQKFSVKLSERIGDSNKILKQELILAQETLIDKMDMAVKEIKNSESNIIDSIKHSNHDILTDLKKFSDVSLTLLKGIENDLDVLVEELHYVEHILMFGDVFNILDTIETRYANVHHDSNTGLIVRDYESDKYVEAVTDANFGIVIGIEDIKNMLITGNGRNWAKGKTIYEENSAEFCSVKWFQFFSLKLTKTLFHYRNGRRMHGNPLPSSFSEKNYHEEHLSHYSEVCQCSHEDLPTVDGITPICNNNFLMSTVGDACQVECWGEIMDAITCEESGQWSVNELWIKKDSTENWICKGSVYFIAGGEGAKSDISLYHPTLNLACSSPPPLNNKNHWYYHSTFYHDNPSTVYLCGSDVNTENTCISHNRDTKGWKTHTLTTDERMGYTTVVLNKRVYFIGGMDKQFGDVGASSTPLPLTDTPVLTPVHNLDYKGTLQCIDTIDEDTLMITGGLPGSDLVATYNVRTFTYKQLPPLKQGRFGHGCGVLERGNTKWIIVAGGLNDYVTLKSTEMMRLGGSEWISVGNLNVARAGHSMVLIQRGVMVMGGKDGRNMDIASVELMDWDSAGKTWSVVEPSLNTARSYFGRALQISSSMFDCTVSEATVFFIAGGDGALRDISVYHPTVDNVACSIIPPTLNNDWMYHTTFYHDNTINICGGTYTASTCISHNKDTEGWKTHTLTTSRKYGHTSVILHKRVYFVGGRDSGGNHVGASSTPLPLTDTPVLTPERNLIYKGVYQCTAKIDEDTLVVTGGWDGRSSLSTVATYNVRTHKYTQLPSLKQPRYGHGCGVLERGDTKWIIVAGGYGDGRYPQATEMLQLGGSEWTQLGNLNVARRGPSMAVEKRGIMIMGGRGSGNKLSSVELLDWDSKTWNVVQPSLNKPRRSFGGAVEIPASMFGCTV